MKTKTIITLTSFCLLISVTKSFSQLALNEESKVFNQSKLSVIKIIINADSDAFNFNTAASSIKVQRAFISYFGENAENNWSAVGNDFINRFHIHGLLTNALFAKNGNLIYVITYGTETNLPADVRKIVKREYYDYTITMVIEVKENKRDIWVVKLDNTSEQITVRIEDNEMEQVQQFQKLNLSK